MTTEHSLPSIVSGTHTWTVGTVIGTGAFSECRLATCGEVPAVLKTTFLSDVPAARAKQLLYIRREIECLSRLRGNVHICQLYDIVELPNSVSLVLEHIQGCDLFTFLQNQPGARLAEDTLKDIVIQLLSALDAMHSASVLHRDLKLDNMMLTSTGILKIIDFNLGVALEPNTMGHVGLNDAVGTPQFASPLVLACGLQQQQNKLFARRGVVTNPSTYIAHECVDMWSAGVCINGLATGRFPFHAKDPQPLLQEIKEYAIGARSIYFPRDLSPMIKHFIQRILSPGKATTAQEMMSHPWLASDFTQDSLRPASPTPSMVSTAVSGSDKSITKESRLRFATDATVGEELSFTIEKRARTHTSNSMRSQATLAEPL